MNDNEECVYIRKCVCVCVCVCVMCVVSAIVRVRECVCHCVWCSLHLSPLTSDSKGSGRVCVKALLTHAANAQGCTEHLIRVIDTVTHQHTCV